MLFPFCVSIGKTTRINHHEGAKQNEKTLIAVIMTVVCVAIIFIFVRNEFVDRFNPFLETEHAYAKVEKGTQYYENVTAYDKSGEKLSYKLTFNGFDPEREYVDIKHMSLIHI
ncbi:YxeA family protein [Staphylococcus condimenti]|nr:YxeA family protein [Staphylococcus condimenti]